ncbi:FIST N-terminal domain-containing protein [Novispirillum sp. DQ9]|uniref:FIST signal transduction protein n=1 Tax=Novispirillum sp. DQ9 TaxID=3398612 RepID=UPI003C7EA19C
MTSGTPFLSATAWGPSPANAVAEAVDDLKGKVSPDALGFAYVTEAYANDLDTILADLRRATGVRHWTGCVAAGVCGRKGFERHGPGGALAIMVAELPPDSFRILHCIRQPEDVEETPLDDWESAERPLLGLIHADPRNTAVHELITLLPDALECYLVGGMTAAPGGPVQVADERCGGGLSGVLISASVPVAVGLTQGCRPIGPPRQITGMDGDWVAALDGRPAIEALKDDVGPEAFSNLRHLGGLIHAALPVEGSDTKDYVVRNLVAVDPHTGRVGISADLTEGERLMFVRRDPEAAEEDLRRMVRRLTARAGTPPRGALYVSCLARGPNMFGDERGELAILAEELGDVPLAGFFANGEVNNNRLYAYTGVLTLFL